MGGLGRAPGKSVHSAEPGSTLDGQSCAEANPKRLVAPEFDRDGYPTEATLEAIKQWPHTDFAGLMDFCGEAWHWPDCWERLFNGRRIEASTGGWSGNESIINALSENEFFFWTLCWQESKRGGHYVFELPESRT